MLKQFKAKQAKGHLKTLVPKKKKTIPDKKEESDSEASDVSVSDSEDSEYEELLIGDIINKTKISEKKLDVKEEKKIKTEVKPDVKPEVKEQLLPPPLKLERTATKPIDIPKPKKKSRKTVIIKKYYQKREPKTTPTPVTQPVSKPTKEIQLNYLGLPMTGASANTTTRNHMTSKIFNW